MLGQVQKYYSFRRTMKNNTMNYSITPADLYNYNSKELQPEQNLNRYAWPRHITLYWQIDGR
jgi:hypothetical protein